MEGRKLAIKGVSSPFHFHKSFSPLHVGEFPSRADFFRLGRILWKAVFCMLGRFLLCIPPFSRLDDFSCGQILAYFGGFLLHKWAAICALGSILSRFQISCMGKFETKAKFSILGILLRQI